MEEQRGGVNAYLTLVVSEYMALLDCKREVIFAELATVDDARLPADMLRLWQRSGPREWSAGEHLAHATVVLRSFRQVFHAFWVVLASLGYLRHGRSCETEIDDVYAGPGFPLNVGWL